MHHDILDFEKVVPKPLLSFYIEKTNIEADKRSFEGMYNSLNEEFPDLVKQLYSSYSCAGKTAVNIFEEVTLPSNYLTKNKMIDILKKETGKSNIFKVEFNPTLSENPQINFIEDRGNSILIQFVAKGKPRRIRDGYKIVTVQPLEFEFAIVHFSGPVLIELRCAYNKHEKFLSCFEEYFKMDMNNPKYQFEWLPITKVTNQEAEEISKRLSAGLVEADHKDDGIYDRHVVTANPDVKDLRNQEQYIKEFKNKMLLSQVLVIDYEDDTKFGKYKAEIKFKINMHTGFQFLSKVSESVIDYVMGVFIDVRYNKGGAEQEKLNSMII